MRTFWVNSFLLGLAFYSFLSCGSRQQEKYIASCSFLKGATIEEKTRMAAHVVPSERQLEWQKMEKTCFIYSEADWNWPGAKRGKGGRGNYDAGGINPEVKKAQLKELLTQYGPVELIWFDHAVGDGGLSHEETTRWVHKFQPNCFVGYNTGEPAGRLCLRERGKAGKLGDINASHNNKENEGSYKGYLVAEFTYPILPKT